MAKKFFLLVIFLGVTAFPRTQTHATDLGINAAALFPVSKFEDVADTGFGIGYHVKVHVFEVFYYGLAINYGTARGDHGVDFWEVDVYPFIDWIFYQTKHVDFFTRGGLGLFHWESDGIWWLDDEGNGIMTTFGAGCRITKNIELIASFTKLYADFDVDYFQVRAGYNFDIGD